MLFFFLLFRLFPLTPSPRVWRFWTVCSPTICGGLVGIHSYRWMMEHVATAFASSQIIPPRIRLILRRNAATMTEDMMDSKTLLDQ